MRSARCPDLVIVAQGSATWLLAAKNATGAMASERVRAEVPRLGTSWFSTWHGAWRTGVQLSVRTPRR